MCTRISAIRRLVALYVEQLLLNPDYHLQISISDALTEENIQAIQSLNLYSEYDRLSVYDAVQSYDRDMELLRAWLSSPMGRLQ
jgi:hypothetical protein